MTEVEQLISNILNNYNNFNATPEKSVYDRLDYLHIQFNCISKLYTVVSSIARVGITERKIAKASKEFIEKLKDLDRIEPRNVIREEIESWGISNTSFSYIIFDSLCELKNFNCDYQECITELSKILGKNKGIISANIKRAIEKADFNNTKYIPILRKLPKEKITKEYIIDQLLDFYR